MKLLFVCSQNRLRSPTAEALFSGRHGTEALSAGTNHDADHPISADLIDWAEIVFVMERIHREKLQERFGEALRNKRLIVLDIPDRYGYMDQELVKLLRERVARHIRI